MIVPLPDDTGEVGESILVAQVDLSARDLEFSPDGQIIAYAYNAAVVANLIVAWGLGQDPDLAHIVRQLEAHAAGLATRFAGHGQLPHLVIHGDYYAGNLLFEDDRIVGVVDYDKVRWQPRVVELAEALIYFASPRPSHLKHLVYPGFLNWESFTCFLHHYAHAVTLDESEAHTLPDYVRCIWLQISLQRLLEKGSRPPEALEALREALDLGDWARANAQQIIEIAERCFGNVEGHQREEVRSKGKTSYSLAVETI